MASRGFIALSLALAHVAGANAQSDKVELEVTSFKVEDGSVEERYIRCGIRSDLPEQTSITFKLEFEDEPIPLLWMAAYLEPGGTAMVEVGPLGKGLLPGMYQVVLVVDPLEQNPEQAEFWSKFGPPFQRVTPQRLGTEEEEKVLRAEAKKPLFQQILAIEKAAAEIHAAEDELKSKSGRFYPDGVLKRDEFVAWADGILAPLTALERFYNSVTTDYYVVYYAGAYKYLLPSVWLNARYAFIDYTIYPVLERERKELEKRGEAYLVPERFQPLKGGTVRPPREAAFALAARDGLKVRQMIGEAPAPPSLTTWVPSGEDLPDGFEIGADVPADLRDLLEANPTVRKTLSGTDVAGISRLLGGFALPPGAPIGGHWFCLTPAPAADGEPSPDANARVLVLLFSFPDATMAKIPVMEMARTDRKREIDWTVLAREETVAIVLPAGDEASKAAATAFEGWLTTKNGFQQAGGAKAAEKDGGEE